MSARGRETRATPFTAIDAAGRGRHAGAMSNEFIAIVVGVAVVGFLWSLHGDMNRLGERVAALGERVARLEGVMEGLRDAIAGRRGAETD